MNDKKKFDYIYKSTLYDRMNEVDALLLEEKHYVYVKNLFGMIYC